MQCWTLWDNLTYCRLERVASASSASPTGTQFVTFCRPLPTVRSADRLTIGGAIFSEIIFNWPGVRPAAVQRHPYNEMCRWCRAASSADCCGIRPWEHVGRHHRARLSMSAGAGDDEHGSRYSQHAVTPEPVIVPARSTPLYFIWHALLWDRLALAGALIIAGFVLGAIFAPWIAPYGPNEADPTLRLQGVWDPRASARLDNHGRDILNRLRLRRANR